LATLTKESSVTIREREQEPARPAPPRATPASGAGEAPRRDPLSRLRGLWEGVLSEINKVTWPTRMETRNLTIVLIGISVLVGGLLGIVDLILVAAIRALSALTGGA